MMMFRTAKDAMVTLLGTQAEGRFRVIGFQEQTKGSDEFTGFERTVQVYYSSGKFPKASGRMRSSKTHDITLEIDFTASAAAQCDLSVLTSETATAQQRALALDAAKEAAEVADISMDELIDAVFNIIMDARNESLGLEKDDISSRWIDGIEKDTIIKSGDLVVKTANMKYTCKVQEIVQGDIGNIPDKAIFNSDIPIGETDGAGVTVENEN